MEPPASRYIADKGTLMLTRITLGLDVLLQWNSCTNIRSAFPYDPGCSQIITWISSRSFSPNVLCGAEGGVMGITTFWLLPSMSKG